MRILTVNNKKDEKILRQPTKKINFKTFPKKELGELIFRLRSTMEKAKGVGLAANQIGEDSSLFVVQFDNKFYAILSPEIDKTSRETTIMEEGCLSVPGHVGDVERPEKMTLRGLDINGKKIKIKAWGILSRIFQHEVDHLNGILFIDKATNIRKYENVRNYGKEQNL